jgi:folylpolyglutamate synthase/dihydropteroate synthase
VVAEPDPATALARAREHGRVLVTGSLYLIADLSRNDA